MSTVTPNHPIHPPYEDKVSLRIESQLPDFVKKDHETFVSFMEAYFEYMEQPGKAHEILGNLDNYANIDKTVTEFLQYFKKQFGEDIPEAIFTNVNKPFLLKRLRDFYRTKGTTRSFEFLFRLLYQEEITISLPREDILRVSDGKYDTSKVLRLIDPDGTIGKLVGKLITGQTSGATAVVENSITEFIGSYRVSTLYLSGVLGVFEANEVITDGLYNFNVGSIITNVTITNPGTLYTAGEIVRLSGGGLGSGGLIRIRDLNTGSMSGVTINNGGTGYKTGDKLTIDNTGKLEIDGRTASLCVKEVDTNGTILRLWMENVGSGYTALPTISGGSGTGADIVFNIAGTGIGGIKSFEVVNSGFAYAPAPTLDLTGLGSGNATAIVNVGGYNENPTPNFASQDGWLSSDKYIQDSFFYQLFSYEIASGHTIDKWRDVVKRVVHPAGLALFGRYQLISNIPLQLSLTNIIPDTLDRYTIIFHDESIGPPVILDLDIETCDAEQDIRDYREADDYGGFDLTHITIDYSLITESEATDPANEDYQPGVETLSTAVGDTDDFGTITEAAATIAPVNLGCVGDVNFPFEIGICSPTNFGLITDTDVTSGLTDLQMEDYELITNEIFTFKPTKCQNYEKDLHIQELQKLDGISDYRYTDIGTSQPDADYGSPDQTATQTAEDYGIVFPNPKSYTQKRLGPIKRTFDNHKFNKQPGYSQYMTDGMIDKMVVFEQGSGYATVPNVTISAPASGTQATAIAVMGTGADADKVVNINITNAGTGYTSLPTITIDAPVSGTTATATAVIFRQAESAISNYSTEQIFTYSYLGGLKTVRSMNTMITQYKTDFEANGSRNVALPFTPV